MKLPNDPNDRLLRNAQRYQRPPPNGHRLQHKAQNGFVLHHHCDNVPVNKLQQKNPPNNALMMCKPAEPNLFQSARVVHRNVAFFSLDAISCSRWLAAVWEQVTILRSPGSRPSLPTILPADPPIHWTNSFITLCPSIKNKENVNGIFRDPQYSDPFPILFPYHSHKNPWRYGNGMGIVWEAYHKEVPLLGVPEITLENAKHIHRHISIYVRV